jgi:hypothetical protein
LSLIANPFRLFTIYRFVCAIAELMVHSLYKSLW